MAKTMQAALDYARQGWLVFPCKLDKTPYTNHGFKDATTDEAQIRAWWNQWPGASIGIATGARSGIIVLDEDTAGEKQGEASFAELQRRYGALPATRTARSGSGGHHHYFRHPGAGIKIGNKESTISDGLPHLDIRGDGGYIIAPPSSHPSGNQYAWENDLDIASLPDAYLALLVERPRATEDASGQVFTTTGDAGRYWLDRALADAKEGNRNARGFWLACQLRDAGMSESDAAGLMAEYAARVPGSGYSEREALSSLRSAQSQPPRTPAKQEGYALTDMGNADRLVARHGQNIRYCNAWGKWLVWNGKRWVEDTRRDIEKWAKETVRSIYAEAAAIENDEHRKEVVKWAGRSQMAQRIGAMIDLARSDLPIVPDELDSDPWLLNVKNGTLNLRTGMFQPHRREDFITKLADVVYDPGVACPLWCDFVSWAMKGDEDMTIYLQKALGYGMTGDVSEHAMFIPWGMGKNGKSTLFGTVQNVLGDYADSMRSDSLMVQRNGSGIPNDIAALKGQRFIVSSEGEEGHRLAESLIKSITGGDMVRARFLRAEFFTFAPTHKIFFFTNKKPVIRGTDEGIWRRIHLIPFDATVVSIDKKLPEKLAKEASGILNWLLAGCLRWQREGLEMPERVQNATKEYRDEMDVLQGFISDCCVVNNAAKAKATQLYEVYKKWCDDNGEYAQKQRIFGLALGERGFEHGRTHGGRIVWKGIGIREEYEEANDDDERVNDTSPGKKLGTARDSAGRVNDGEPLSGINELVSGVSMDNAENSFTIIHPSPSSAIQAASKAPVLSNNKVYEQPDSNTASPAADVAQMPLEFQRCSYRQDCHKPVKAFLEGDPKYPMCAEHLEACGGKV